MDAYLASHLLVSIALAAYFLWRLHRSVDEQRDSAALQIVTWSAFAGPFGVIAAAAFSICSQNCNDSSQDSITDDVAKKVAPIEEAERVQIALLDRRIRIEGSSLIRPLMDVIAQGSQAEKLEALGVVYRRHEAQLSEVLRCALRDSDASVRVLAATVIAKLNTRYVERAGELMAIAKANPGSAKSWRDLADARLAYADSGLLQASQAESQVELAINDLSTAIRLDPADQASAGRLDIERQRLCARSTSSMALLSDPPKYPEAL
jgi:hypothetical protein